MCAVMGDFVIPREIHKKTWDYPLMPEKASIPEECLSPKQVELNTNNRTKHNPHQQYLLQTMWDKLQYFVYGEILDYFYLQQGVEIAHLYCGTVFNVKEWR